MCWILTIDNQTFQKKQLEVMQEIRLALYSNPDGASLVFLGANSADDMVFRTMDTDVFCSLIPVIMTKTGRLFVHLRMATTAFVGIGFSHAFDDMSGKFYMHNGVIENKNNLPVDSFNIAFSENTLDNEQYANVFIIDAVSRDYSVIRKIAGSLFTDYFGNFCTYGIFSNQVDTNYNDIFPIVSEENGKLEKSMLLDFWDKYDDDDEWRDDKWRDDEWREDEPYYYKMK